MVNRFGKWWLLGAALIVLWTLVVFAYGWTNLPRAHSMPHDPQYLSMLSDGASSILFRSGAAQKSARSPLIWSESPRIARMLNGAELTFPADTTSEQTAYVASEYRQILQDKAREHRWVFLIEMLAVWLAPCACLLFAGSALSANPGGLNSPISGIAQRYVRQRTDQSALACDPVDNGARANPPMADAASDRIDYACPV